MQEEEETLEQAQEEEQEEKITLPHCWGKADSVCFTCRWHFKNEICNGCMKAQSEICSPCRELFDERYCYRCVLPRSECICTRKQKGDKCAIRDCLEGRAEPWGTELWNKCKGCRKAFCIYHADYTMKGDYCFDCFLRQLHLYVRGLSKRGSLYKITDNDENWDHFLRTSRRYCSTYSDSSSDDDW